MQDSDFLTQIVPPELQGCRLDKAIALMFPGYSRSRLQQWIRDQRVCVDGEYLKQKSVVQGGEWIEIDATADLQVQASAQPISFPILYEDDTLLVISKPAGLVVHPGAGNPDGTLMNGLLSHSPALQYLPRAGIVHRLDKDTSGLMVVAKTPEAHLSLIEQLQERSVSRHYLALVSGIMVAGGTISDPIGRHPVDRKRMAVVHNGRDAITHYRVEERFPAHTLLAVKLETGRTHQIRVHMQHIKHALVGDPIYGSRARLPAGCNEAQRGVISSFKRQALHARELELIHPRTGESMKFKTPQLPDDFAALLNAYRGAAANRG